MSNNNLRTAMRLYEHKGNPTSSLRECQKVWNNQSSSSDDDGGNNNDQKSSSSLATAAAVSTSSKQQQQQQPSLLLSRQHNEVILQNLSAQRHRSRRVRPRPSSFDADNSSSSAANNTAAAAANDDVGATTTGDTAGKDDDEQQPSATSAAASDNEGDLITLLNNILTISHHQQQQQQQQQQNQSIITPPSNNNNNNSQHQLKNSQHQLNNNNNNNNEKLLLQRLITTYNLSLAQYAQQNEYTPKALEALGGVLFHWMDVVTIVVAVVGTNTNNDKVVVYNKERDGIIKGERIMMVQFKEGEENDIGNNTATLLLPLNSTYVMSILSILSRVAFLFLDCLLAMNVGNGRGVLEETLLEVTLWGDEDHRHHHHHHQGGSAVKKSVSVQHVLGWVENVILVYAKQRVKSGGGDDNIDGDGEEEEEEGMVCGGDTDVLKADEVKFKLHLYKSRLLLQGTRRGKRPPQQQKMDGETRARLARKELKNAMDIYQNKLCVLEDGSVEKGGGGGSNDNEKGKTKGVETQQQQQRGGGKQGNNNNNDTSETTSISGSLVTSASDGLWNEGKGGVVARATFEGMPNNKQQQKQQQQSPPQKAAAAATVSSPTPVTVKVKVKKDNPGLHVRHESALYMKANLEYLRGNTTKSLKLCAEARTAGKKSRVKATNIDGGGQSGENGFVHNDDATAADSNGNKIDTVTEDEDVEIQMANDYDEAIYYNNLAMVHQSAGKIHVALHYYAYAISYMENVQLPNDNYFWSDGVARPNVTADILNNISLCAFQAHDYKRAYECMARCVTLSPSIFRERARCWLRMAQSLIGIHANQQWTTTTSNESVGLINDTSLIECNLGSDDDLCNISTNPFPRILSCLEKAQHLSGGTKEGKYVDSDLDCFEAATLSLAYAKLELNDAAGALEMCKAILGSNDIAAIAKEDRTDYTSESLRSRAMARLYACEAFCRMGDPNSALFIVESESSLQCLALDISASNSTQHDAYAQFATRATASGTFSSTGSIDRSKLHASMTTGVAEKLTADTTKGNVDNVFEKRVHLFSRLKEGDTDGAIAILRSGLGRV